MTAGLTATLSAAIFGSITKANDLAAVAAAINERCTATIAPGTGVGKADILFSDTRTISASSSENLDLAGVLSDVFGSTLTAAKVKAILFKAAAGNTNDVAVGGATSNAFVGPFGAVTDYTPGAYLLGTEAIAPGGWSMHVHPGAGWTVTAATGDLLKVANSSSGTPVTYDVVIVAASA
jgi:hypothetical protein